MKLCWIYVKSPTLIMKYNHCNNYVLYDTRPKDIIEYCQKNANEMDYFIMDANRSPLRQVHISWLFNQLIVLPTDDPYKNYNYLKLNGVE